MLKLTILEAKNRLRIPDLWHYFRLPGQPKQSCRCPFHEDRNNSFSVFHQGMAWNCFAGCGGGDAIDFLAWASGLDRKTACRKFLDLARGGGGFIPIARPQAISKKPRPNYPPFDQGTSAELEQVAELRNLSVEGLQLATKCGLLWFATLKGQRAWIVTDSQRLNAQARRLDGGVWDHKDGNPKAWTLAGSWAKWPVGVNEAQPFPNLALCEGGPDLLAAFHFIHCEDREHDCTAVAMLGANLDMHPDALPVFAGKRIRIFGHADANGAGRQAVDRWAAQLTEVGADVDAFDFTGLHKVDGSTVKDLNDCTSILADDFEVNRELWGMLP
jgi:hypothetical protein